MPYVRYTLRLGEELFSEEDIFEPTSNPEALVNETILLPLNKRREELGEDLLTLESVVVTKPYVHLHSWKRTSIDRFNLRCHYYCTRCEITGHRPYHTVNGEAQCEIERDPAFKKVKYELCRDPLKEMPKKLSF